MMQLTPAEAAIVKDIAARNAGEVTLTDALIALQNGKAADTAEKSAIHRGTAMPKDDGKVQCSTCGGSGKILEGHRTCPDCHGSGKVDPNATDAQKRDAVVSWALKRMDEVDASINAVRALRALKADARGAVMRKGLDAAIHVTLDEAIEKIASTNPQILKIIHKRNRGH